MTKSIFFGIFLLKGQIKRQKPQSLATQVSVLPTLLREHHLRHFYDNNYNQRFQP